jgi:hypothetical protein
MTSAIFTQNKRLSGSILISGRNIMKADEERKNERRIEGFEGKGKERKKTRILVYLIGTWEESRSLVVSIFCISGRYFT